MQNLKEEKIQEYRNEIRYLTKMLNSQQTLLKGVEKKIESNKNECVKIRQDIANHKESISSAQNKNNKLDFEIIDLTLRKATRREQLEEARSFEGQTLNKIRRLETQVIGAKNKVATIQAGIQSWLKHFREENYRNTGFCKVQDHITRYQNLVRELPQARKELDSAKYNLELARDELRKHRERISELNEQINKLHTEAREKEHEISKNQQEINRAESEISSLEKSLDSKNFSIKEDESWKKRLQEKIESTNKEIAEYEQEIRKLMTEQKHNDRPSHSKSERFFDDAPADRPSKAPSFFDTDDLSATSVLDKPSESSNYPAALLEEDTDELEAAVDKGIELWKEAKETAKKYSSLWAEATHLVGGVDDQLKMELMKPFLPNRQARRNIVGFENFGEFRLGKKENEIYHAPEFDEFLKSKP